MIIRQLPFEEIAKSYRYGDYSTLEPYELNKVPTGVTHIYYYYLEGDYEGSGCMLLVGENGFAMYDLGHCSCYGPMEDITREGVVTWHTSINSLQNFCSKNYLEEIAPLIKLMKMDFPDAI